MPPGNWVDATFDAHFKERYKWTVDVFLAGVLGYPVPTYAHVPLAVNAQGARLAKRDGAVTLADLRQLGVDPAEVMTMIARSLQMARPRESANLDRLLQRFDPALIPREPWIVGAAGPLDSLL